jgi:signal transduction histidine kinase
VAATETRWLSRLNAWRTSIHAYLQALSFAVIAGLSIVSLIGLRLLPIQVTPPATVYEMSRLVKAQPLAHPIGSIHTRRVASAPFESDTAVERLLAAQLAAHLQVPVRDVRFSLPPTSSLRAEDIAREIALYGPDGLADPHVLGSFALAVRDGDGWREYTRTMRGLPALFWQGLIAGSLVALLLTLWFSARLARTLRLFAAAARRIPGSRQIEPIPVQGPSEIRAAARSLNDMQARIARHVRERATLTGAIAHDLRAPLSRLRFRLLAAPEAVRNSAEDEICEMERMIESLLNFVENDIRPTKSEPLNLTALVEGVADNFSDQGHDVKVVEGAAAIRTMGDSLLLKRLFDNVIGNAVQYGGSAEVEIAHSGTQAVVHVRDHGPGMSHDAIGRAFEPFFRGEPSRNRQTGGVGLGLAIAEAAATAHGGTVTLSNLPERGLEARIVIPIVTQGGGRADPASKAPRPVRCEIAQAVGG